LLPTWSPDGKTIVYQSNAKGGFHLYSKPADGSGSEQIVLESEDATEGSPNLSPDGRYLAFARRPRAGNPPSLDLWAQPLFGDRKPFPIVQTAFDKSGLVISPDSKWLAYDTSASGRN
jgi:tricorn protease